ncbi:hypothetical protein GCM10011351_18730 [Paraliobacillus quinghaiensis]|uniref:Uncharacterized protein n=1 Tax=Paraliobacillus quinghaiensis TaxID=470815 RepID=A0A917TQX9_9BACI|nr:hypothetical protein [Paraliobacillus quinghaiensis]GGM32922.1 hypothetical protein GCM10011351_18730 [Paraliobacillus quinghaiensis]
MKKYWKSTAIIAVIVISIGTFYINAALSAPEYPMFIIEKQSGQDQALGSLAVEGFYHETASMNYVNTNVTITSEGSEYNSRTFIDQIIGQPAPMIEDLQNEHRYFMRGKGLSTDSYFESDQMLAYAEATYSYGSMGPEDFTFDIGILDKQTNDTNAFTVEIPESLEIDYIYVEDVQVVDNVLHVITYNVLSNNNNNNVANYIYTIDLTKETVSSYEAVFTESEQQEDLDINTSLVRTNPKQANEQLLYLKTENKEIEDQESIIRIENLSKELISYNLKTKEKTIIDLGERLKENDISYYVDSTVYLTKINEQNLVVTPYQLEDQQFGNPYTIELSGETGEGHSPMIEVHEGKLYVTTRRMTDKINANVTMVDVKTGETLYKGEVITKEDKEDLDEFELYIHDISVR